MILVFDIPSDFAFLALAALTLISSLLAIEAKELIYGAIALGVSFIGVAGLFVLLDAPYLAMLQVAIYVGAIVVLMLFTLMLVRRDVGEELKDTPEGGLGRAGLWVGSVVAIAVGGVAYLSTQTTATKPVFRYTLSDLGSILSLDYGVPLIILGLLITATLLGALTLVKREEGE